MQPSNPSRFLASLLIALPLVVACGGTPDRDGDGDGDSSCTCNISYNDQSDTVSCGTGTCFSSDDRWAFCTATGDISWGDRTCVQDAWDDTTNASFTCDGTTTCAAGTYCAVKAGPTPRRSECRPIPGSCTPPSDERGYADCLFEDARNGTVCSGASELVTSSVYLPRAAEITCD